MAVTIKRKSVLAGGARSASSSFSHPIVRDIHRAYKKYKKAYSPPRSRSRSSSRSAPKRWDSGGSSQGANFTKCVLTKKPSKFTKGLAAVTNPNTYVYSSSGVIFQNTSGKQTSNTVGIALYGSDLRAISQALVPSATAGYRSNKFLVQSAEVETLFTNQTNACHRMWIYDVELRRDVTAAAVSSYEPIAAWTTGLLDNAEAETDSYDFFGSRPMDSPLFRQYYKIVGKKLVILPASSHHVHKVFIKARRIVNYEAARGFDYVRGLTHLTFVVAHGFPANDATPNTTNVAITGCKIDYVTTTRIKYQGLKENIFHLYYNNGQAAMVTPMVTTEETAAPYAAQ